MARSDVPRTKSSAKTGLSKTSKDWLTELHQRADRARHEVCYHEPDPLTSSYTQEVSHVQQIGFVSSHHR